MSNNNTPNNPDLSIYAGFFKKTIEERRAIINSNDEDSTRALEGELPFDYANKMIENCVGRLSLPVGVCPYLIMNNEHYVVPMATEEPSVIAACSGISKLVAENGGFEATTTGNIMFTQVQIQFRPKDETLLLTEDDDDFYNNDGIAVRSAEYNEYLALTKQCVEQLREKKDVLIEQANTHCPSMVKRGGGCVDVQFRVVEPTPYPLIADDGNRCLNAYCEENKINYIKATHGISTEQQDQEQPFYTNLPSICLYFRINVCNAMGANLVNNIAEGIAPYILNNVEDFITTTTATTATPNEIEVYNKYQPFIGLRILSNLCLDRLTTARFALPLDKLQWKEASGLQVARGVVQAYYFARDDVFRAVTHNKGVMNGITAAALATGQDTRAIEASIHAYASIYSEQGYKPVTRYWIDTKKNTFNGEINVPIAVGTVGGALGEHKLFAWALKQLKSPNSAQLAQILACIGLAQNFAALRALAVEGIQQGHMKLHARKTAAAATPAPQ